MLHIQDLQKLLNRVEEVQNALEDLIIDFEAIFGTISNEPWTPGCELLKEIKSCKNEFSEVVIAQIVEIFTRKIKEQNKEQK